MTEPDHIQRLVVLGGTVTGLALLRSAAPLGLDLHLFDDKADIASHSRYGVKHLLTQDNESLVLDELIALVSKPHTALIADSDGWLRFLLAHWDAITHTGCQILHGPRISLDLCLDKTHFIEWCKAHELPVPENHALNEDGRSLQGEADFPLLLRPEFTVHGQGTGLPKAQEVHTEDELTGYLERFASAGVPVNVSQSLLRPGIRQLSVGITRRCDGGFRSLLAEKRRPTAEACAAGTYVSLITSPSAEQQAALALARRAIESLDYVGIAEVEILHDQDTGQSYLIEINVRPWAQLPLADKSRQHFLAFLLARTEARPSRPRQAHWISFQDDLFHCFSRSMGLVRKGRLSLLQYLLSLTRANTFVHWHWRDPRPWWQATRRWLGL